MGRAVLAGMAAAGSSADWAVEVAAVSGTAVVSSSIELAIDNAATSSSWVLCWGTAAAAAVELDAGCCCSVWGCQWMWPSGALASLRDMAAVEAGVWLSLDGTS